MSSTILVDSNTSSSPRQESSPTSVVVLLPKNVSLTRRSNSTCKSPLGRSPIALPCSAKTLWFFLRLGKNHVPNRNARSEKYGHHDTPWRYSPGSDSRSDRLVNNWRPVTIPPVLLNATLPFTLTNKIQIIDSSVLPFLKNVIRNFATRSNTSRRLVQEG